SGALRNRAQQCDRATGFCRRRGSRLPRVVAYAPALARAQARGHRAPVAAGPPPWGRIMNGRIPNPGVRPLHQGQPVAHAGAVVSRANAAMTQPESAYFAPQAAGRSWEPQSFLAPVADNEPWLSSALQVIAEILRNSARDGIPPSRVVLLGFSQGGCLALEFAARNARRYAAVIGLSAGLIGPNGTSR